SLFTDRRVTGLCLLTLVIYLTASTNLVVTTTSPVTGTRGHQVTLPCWLSPQQNAEELEVRWYRTNRFDSPVMHYQSKKFKYQEPAYVGRVSFGLKDAASGGLKSGDVSLKLLNVTTEDTGDFFCYVSSNQGYDSAPVNLLVTASGSPPFLSVVWGENDKVNVSCESEGWYPQPVLRWSDKKQDVKPQSLVYRNLSSGLFLVHSWLLLSSTSEPSCSVGLSDKEVKEAKVSLGTLHKTLEPGKETFCVCVIVILCLFVFDCKYRLQYPTLTHQYHCGKLHKTFFNHLHINVKLEDRNNPYLKVVGNRVREAHPDDLPGKSFPDGEMVTCVTAIKGTSGFSSGKHYWEVSMRRINTDEKLGIKQSWWVGVTSAAEIPSNSSTSFPNTSNGFWFLSSSPKRANSFQFSTQPEISIPFHSRPETVGVYLDCDSGELSFYNVEEKTLIGSFTATFKGEIFPLFNPGKGDTSPMEVVQREVQSQTGDEGNCAESNTTHPAISI
uniref:Ig-like domain-containing protein n=1 Tax=Astatotilapia calliptera TaxID=8154 RepID=A0A3P8NIQ7_ASTCA